jgi:hypothetical protein
MAVKKRMSLKKIVDEHNVLNGFGFVRAEFLLVALSAAYISYAGIVGRSVAMTIIALGIIANALAVWWRATVQMQNGQKDIGIRRAYFGTERGRIRRAYPNLTGHTVLLSLVMLTPFLLFIALLFPE